MTKPTKRFVLRWFVRELRQHKLLTLVTIASGLLYGLLAEVALPYLIASFLRDVGESEVVPGLPVALFYTCLAMAVLAPIRSYLLRVLEYAVRHDLAARIDAALRARTNVLTRLTTELTGATKTFLEAWTDFSILVLADGLPFVVGFCGMVAMMAMFAPYMLLAIAAMLALALFCVKTVGRWLNSKWSARVRSEHDEYEAFGGLVANHSVYWLLQLASKGRAAAGRRWIKNARAHGWTVFWWQACANILVNALLITVIAGSVVLAGGAAIELGTVFLLVWFTVQMAGRINSLFFMGEAIGSRIAEAQLLVEELEGSVTRPLPGSDKVWRLSYKNAAVTYTEAGSDGASIENVVSLPDLVFESGITLVTGDNGKGKSTLLRAAVGVQPYTGSVVLSTPDGDIEARDFDVRPMSVYVAQSNVPLGSGTVLSLFEGATEAELYQALRWGAFPGSVPVSRPLVNCSGGERRLAFNAAALHAARHTRLLLLDEPTNDLSRVKVQEMISGLEAFAKYHPEVIAVIVSHDPDLLQRGYRTIYM